METLLDILRKRRSIRRYKDRAIEENIVDKLKEAALRSPTSRGINPWRFFFITDKARLEELSRAKEDCSIASIIMQLAGISLGLGSCWIQIRNRMHRGSQASEDFVRSVLHLSENMRVESIISFGYPDEEKPPIPAGHLEYGRILQ
jgi:nitroreductase